VRRPEIEAEKDVDAKVKKLHKVLSARARRRRARDRKEVPRVRAEARRAAPPPARASGSTASGNTTRPRRVVDFKPLPYSQRHTAGAARSCLDAKLGWVLLTAEGGHPANAASRGADPPLDRAARRAISVSGILGHHQKEGDGVRARIVSSQDGELAS
jgi:hypothetical protein